MPLVENKQAIYSDIDLTFEASPKSKDVVTLVNEQAVLRSINHSIFFNKFDVPFEHLLYSSVKNMLFEPLNYLTAISLEASIRHVLKKLEPRIDITSVKVSENTRADGYDVTLVFNIKYHTENNIQKIFLKRIR
jgi:hypothetical protein